MDGEDLMKLNAELQELSQRKINLERTKKIVKKKNRPGNTKDQENSKISKGDDGELDDPILNIDDFAQQKDILSF